MIQCELTALNTLSTLNSESQWQWQITVADIFPPSCITRNAAHIYSIQISLLWHKEVQKHYNNKWHASNIQQKMGAALREKGKGAC